MKKPTIKPRIGRPPKVPDTIQVQNLKETVESLTDDFHDVSDKLTDITMERNRLKGEVAELQRMLPHAATAPKGAQGEALDNEMVYLRRLLALLENLDPPLRRRLLAMVDARYFDPPAKVAK